MGAAATPPAPVPTIEIPTPFPTFIENRPALRLQKSNHIPWPTITTYGYNDPVPAGDLVPAGMP